MGYLKTRLENKPGLQSRALAIRTYLSNPEDKHGQILTRVLRLFQLADRLAKASTARGFYEKNVRPNKEVFMR